MQSKSKSAKHYFDQVPKEWDTLYSHENRFLFFLNKLLRSGLYERYKLTFENCGEIKGARVLDIGCGTGRYSMEFAKRGASNVVGIDFAPAMVEFSNKKQKRWESLTNVILFAGILCLSTLRIHLISL